MALEHLRKYAEGGTAESSPGVSGNLDLSKSPYKEVSGVLSGTPEEQKTKLNTLEQQEAYWRARAATAANYGNTFGGVAEEIGARYAPAPLAAARASMHSQGVQARQQETDKALAQAGQYRTLRNVSAGARETQQLLSPTKSDGTPKTEEELATDTNTALAKNPDYLTHVGKAQEANLYKANIDQNVFNLLKGGVSQQGLVQKAQLKPADQIQAAKLAIDALDQQTKIGTSPSIVNEVLSKYGFNGYTPDQVRSIAQGASPSNTTPTNTPVASGNKGAPSAPTPTAAAPSTPSTSNTAAPTLSQAMDLNSSINAPKPFTPDPNAPLQSQIAERDEYNKGVTAKNKEYNDTARTLKDTTEKRIHATERIEAILNTDAGRKAQKLFSDPGLINAIAEQAKEGARIGHYNIGVNTEPFRLNFQSAAVKTAFGDLLKQYTQLKVAEFRSAYFPGLRTTNQIASMESSLAPGMNETPELIKMRSDAIRLQARADDRLANDWLQWSAAHRRGTYQDFENTPYFRAVHSNLPSSMRSKAFEELRQRDVATYDLLSVLATRDPKKIAAYKEQLLSKQKEAKGRP